VNEIIDYLEKLALAGKNLILISDFDGTLVPIKEDFKTESFNNEAIHILSELKNMFSEIFVLSGRPLDFIEKQFEKDKKHINLYAYFGNEILDQVGKRSLFAPLHQRETFSGMSDRARELFGYELLENKPLGFTLHYRNNPDLKNEMKDFVKRCVKEANLKLIKARCAYELIWSKARIKKVSALKIAGKNATIVYAGDDDSDWEAIKELKCYSDREKKESLTIFIKSDEVEIKDISCIDLLLESQSQFVEFLIRLADRNQSV
jgi:trehalose-phosphatase